MSDDNCPICLEKITSNKKKLKCQHTFHENCISKWYENSKYNKYLDEPYKIGKCPVCRNKSEELFVDNTEFDTLQNIKFKTVLFIIGKRLFSSLANKN